MRDPVLQSRAKAMRNAPTTAERIVWRILRQPPFDAMHFRRQVAFGQRYIADFASHRAKVIVEVDGPTHDASISADDMRTAWFTARGYRTVRVTNSDVRETFDLPRLLAHLLGAS